jgi:membrane associated rhomboid family serine protease
MSINTIILLLTVVVSIACFNNRNLFYKLQFNAWQIKSRKEGWRFFSHALVHADWMHLIFNMFSLFMFGGIVESYYRYYFGIEKGLFYFIILYVGGIFFAAIPSYEKHKNHEWYNSVGASGAVSAVVFSYIIFDPMNSICLYGILCLPGIVWGVVYMVYSWYSARNQNDVVNHDAHLGGAIFGLLFTTALKPELASLFMEKIAMYFR